MGTFHQDKGELHGVTVVVDTDGPEVFVGRCHEVRPDGVLLLDADVHSAAPGAAGKQEWVRRAAEYGVWPKHRQVLVPTANVVSVQRLGEVLSDAPGGPAAEKT